MGEYEASLVCDVFIGHKHVGELSGVPRNGTVRFSYNEEYVSAEGIPLGGDLPITELEHEWEGLPPFFQHYVAEGSSKENFKTLLGGPEGAQDVSELELLAHFRHDFFGAISIVPRNGFSKDIMTFPQDAATGLADINKAMFPGWRPKLLARQDRYGDLYVSSGEYEPGESTHIIKLRSEEDRFVDRLMNEYLATETVRALLPGDEVCEVSLGEVKGIEEDVLQTKRFDRYAENGSINRVDFREFAQLLGYTPETKDTGYFREMADFIYDHLPLPSLNGHRTNIAGDRLLTHKDDVEILFKRVCAFFLIGNSDAHMKNFGLIRQEDGTWRLAPVYDVETPACYNKNDPMALGIGNARGLAVQRLETKHLVMLAQDFRLPPERAKACIETILGNIDKATDNLNTGPFAGKIMVDRITEFMGKRRKAFEGFEKEIDNWVAKGKYTLPKTSKPVKIRHLRKQNNPLIPG